MAFSTSCTLCPRLATFLREVRLEHADYHAKPVPSFDIEQHATFRLNLVLAIFHCDNPLRVRLHSSSQESPERAGASQLVTFTKG